MGDREAMQNNHTKLNTIIILLVAIFFSMVGMGIGYYMNRPHAPKYVFTPGYIAHYIPQYVTQIKNEQDIQLFKELSQSIQIRNLDLNQIGNFVEVNQSGLTMHSKNTKGFSFHPIEKTQVINVSIGNKTIPIINDYIEKRDPFLVDKIDTQYKLDSFTNSFDMKFFPWRNEVKMGAYIMNESGKGYQYHTIDPHKYRFSSIVEDYLHKQQTKDNKQDTVDN